MAIILPRMANFFEAKETKNSYAVVLLPGVDFLPPSSWATERPAAYAGRFVVW